MRADDRLSRYFTYGEATRTAIRNVDNTPDATSLHNLRRLCNECLDPIRDLLGAPVIVHSMYRNRVINARVGGTQQPPSQHLFGQACDFHVHGVDLLTAAATIAAAPYISFDQLILEYIDATGMSGWLHISYRDPAENRQQLLKRSAKGSRHIRASDIHPPTFLRPVLDGETTSS